MHIDKEFKGLISPLSTTEYAQLEANIIAEGCRDALVVWKETDKLLDGHNRFYICENNAIEFDIIELSFEDRHSAMLWILSNQLGRRNLTDEQRTYYLGARYELEVSHEKPRTPGGHYEPQEGKASERLAISSDESASTIKRAAKYKQAVDRIAEHSDELKDSILAGETDITKKGAIFFNGVAKNEPEIAAIAVDEILAGNAKDFPQGIAIARKEADKKQQSEIAAIIEVSTDYVHGDCLEELKQLKPDSVRLLLTDPPYGISYQSNRRTASAKASAIANDGNGAIDLFYDMLGAIHDAMQLECHLLVFTTWKVEYSFMEVLRSYGYDIRSSLIWVKENHTSGDLGGFAPKHERIIHASRGSAKIKPRVADVLTVSRSYSTGHPTEKPVDLLTELINCTTSVGDLVVDPFAGTGATVLAAKQLNRNVFGIELELEWYNIGKIRLK